MNGYRTFNLILTLGFAACIVLSSCAYRRKTVPAAIPSKPAVPRALALGTSTPTGPPEAGEGGPVEPVGPLSLTLRDAVLTALENNPSFRIERLRPAVIRTQEQSERAAFDPTLSAGIRSETSRDEANVENQAADDKTDSDSTSADISIKEFFPTGTTVELGVGQTAQSTEAAADTESDAANMDITITQSLLRGRGIEANLARLRRARLDVEISEYELRGTTEALVAQTEQAYWNYILAERSIEIYEKSLEVAEQQIKEVKERIQVGNLAETESAAAEAEAASRREQLIEARGTLAKRRLDLIKLLNASGAEPAWNRRIELLDAPELPAVKLESVGAHVRLAMQERADFHQAWLEVRRGELEVARTRNGLLPKLDLFVSLGGSRYANSFSNQNDEDGNEVEYAVGINFEIPLGNRDARAEHERAMLSMKQTEAALRNMGQLVQVDVRSAYVDVKSAQERVNATKATRQLREKTLSIEEEKFRVGRSTAFLVSQARRDLVASRIAEVQAIIAYRKALLDLYRLDGSLLPRWGIEAGAWRHE